MGVSSLTFKLNNSQVVEPIEWQDLKISASFGDISGQPSIETEVFTFVNDAAILIKNYINAGLSGGLGIFEGIPATMQLFDQDRNQVILDGYLDLTDELEEIEPQFKGDNPIQIKAKFVNDSSLDAFDTVISGVSIPYLETIGVFTDADYVDLPFIIEFKYNPLDVAIIVISIYTLEQAIEDAISRIASAIATATGIGASGITGPIGAVIYTIAIVAIEIALAIAMIVLIIQLAIDMVNLVLSPVRNHKTTPLRTLIEKSLNHFGYNLLTDLTALDEFHYLPSKPFSDSTELSNGIFPEPITVKKGIPKAGDFGYFITEQLELVRRLFNARVDIIGNDIYIYNASNSIWRKMSTYEMPDILLPGQGYNADELQQTNLMQFNTDPSDQWTIENYTGTAYEVKTEPVTVSNPKRVSIKGLREISIPLALATVKDRLNNLEKILKIFTDAASGLMGIFKKGKKLRNILTRRVGMMKVSGANHTVAKLVLIQNGQIPLDHRETLGARALYEGYYKSISFVDNEDNAQRLLYKGVTIPFTLKDYQAVIKNSNFTTNTGAEARFRSLEWQLSSDTAQTDFEVQTRYTNNLKETKIEATL